MWVFAKRKSSKRRSTANASNRPRNFHRRGLYCEALEDRRVLDCSSAVAISVPSTTSGEFAEDGSVHCFSFEATAGELVTITTTVDTVAVTSLLDMDGETKLASKVNWRGHNFAPVSWEFDGPPTLATTELDYVLPGTGTFFVLVADAPDISLGDFGLHITTTASENDDHGNTVESATALSIPASIDASIEIPIDSDFFSFDVEPHELYHLEVTRDRSVSLRLQRHASDGEILETIYSPSHKDDFAVHRLAAADGVNTWSISGEVGDFSLKANSVSYADDHGNASDMGTLITVPSTTAGIIETTGDLDYFSFEAIAGTEYSIFTETEDALPDKSIQVIGYETVQNYGARESSRTWTAPTDGNFTLEVGGFASDYSLRVEVTTDDHGDTPDSATQLSPTDSVLPYLFSGDVDYFQFEATAGDLYSVNTTAATWHRHKVSLYDSMGELLRPKTSDDGRATLDWMARTSGTYSIELAGGSGRGIVSLNLEVIDYDDDYANLTDNATPVDAFGSTVGEIEASGDVDLFTFQATEQTLYEIRLSNLSRLAVRIYREGDWPGSGVRAANGFWIAPANGTYILAVESASTLESPVGSYQLSVAAVIYDDDNSHPGEAATPVSVPSQIFGEIEVDGDVDRFSFEVVEGNLYTVVATDLDPDVFRAFRWSVTDSSGSRPQGSHDSWVATSTGTFTVEVSARKTAEYSLTISSEPNLDHHGDSFETATEIGIPSTVDAKVNSLLDIDFFKFTATSGTRYLFSNVYGELEVYDTSGTFLFTSWYWDYDISAWRAAFTWTPPEDGTYFVRSNSYFGLFPSRHGFSLEVANDDHSGTFSEATPINGRSKTNATIDFPEDTDAFSIEATEGALYLFSIVDPEGFQRVGMHIYNSESVSLQNLPSSKFAWMAPSTGTYYLVAAATHPARYGNQYQVRIDVRPPGVDVIGDINLDRRVDSDDLGLLLNDFGDPPSETWPTDLNNDLLVDSTDLGLLLNNFDFANPRAQAALSFVTAPAPNETMDVNRDGLVSKLDAELIINQIHGETNYLVAKFDLNADNRITPLDALLVINRLNQSQDSVQMRTLFTLEEDDEKDRDSLADRVFAKGWKRA